MKTQTIHTNAMTLQPFFGRTANLTAHNLTGSALPWTVATTHDQNEGTMNSAATHQHELARNVQQPSSPQQEVDRRTRIAAALKLVELPQMAIMAVVTAVKNSISMRVAIGISLATLLLIPISFAQQPSTSTANVTNTSTATIQQDGNAESLELGDSEEQQGSDSLFTAHCFCKVGTSDPNSDLTDFGTIATYPYKSKKYRTACYYKCWQHAEDWANDANNRPTLCTDFYKAGGNTLHAWWKLADGSWFEAYQMAPSSYSYPLSCGVSSGIKPRYYVLDLIYPPPGCTPDTSTPTGYNCKPGSSVTYGTGSSTGTTTSNESSIKNDVTYSATLGTQAVNGIMPFSAGLTFGYTGTQTQGASETISKTSSSTLTWPVGGGPISPDGIYWDKAMVVLLLNPGVIFADWQDPSTSHQYVAWTMGFTGDGPVTANLPISWLRWALLNKPSTITSYPDAYVAGDAPDPMPENVYDSLTGPPYNLTLDDFHNIAMLDPYWNKGTQPITIDKTRFTAEPFDFPYEAPLGPAPYWDCLGKTVTVTNSFTDSGTSSSSQQYSVGWDVAFGDPLHFLKLDAKGDIVWTNTVSHQNTQMDSQSASATVNCSSLAWGNNPLNPHRVNVYFDNFYGSFLFDLSDLPPADQLLSSGQVVDSSSEPARGMKLELSYANRTYHTFTDNDGNFAFYSEDGPSKALRAELSVIGPSQTITQTVSVGGTTAVALPSSFHQQPR